MSGKDLFIAIGDTDEKIAAKNVSRFNKKIPEAERSNVSSNVFSVFKITATAASVLLIIGFAVFMWVFSEKMKDPPVSPAESGTETEIIGTEAPTDTEPDSTEPPETEAQTEAPEPLPETDYELAGYLIKKLAVADMDEDEAKAMQAQLFSLGDDALYYCADNYSLLSNDEKTVIGMFISEYVKDEVTGTDIGIMQGYSFIDFAMDRQQKMVDWYAAYVILAKRYAEKVEKTDFEKDLPVTYKILSHVGFKDYAYIPENHTVKENVDRAIETDSFTAVNIYKGRYFDESGGFTDDEYAMLYDLYKTGNDAEKAICSYIIYCYIQHTHDFFELSRIYGFESTGLFYEVNEEAGTARPLSCGEMVSDAEKVSLWLQNVIDAAKAEAASLCREEFAEYYPLIYERAEKEGLGAYKEGEPDIAFRAHPAIEAALNLFWAVEYGDAPHVSGLRYEETGHCIIYDRDDFYGYFEKYLDKDAVKAYAKESWCLWHEDGKVYLDTAWPKSTDEMDFLRNARIVSQSGNKAVIAADVPFPSGMFEFSREMTFEVTEDKNGVRITGGTFVEKVLNPDTGAAQTVFDVLSAYLILREGQTEYNDSKRIVYEYTKYEDIPEALKYAVSETEEFPVYLCSYINTRINSILASENIKSELFKKTDLFDGVRFYPENADPKIDLAFEHGVSYYYGSSYALIWNDIMFAMKTVKSSKNSITVSLDFVKTENGKEENVTYTFELKIEKRSATDEEGRTYSYYAYILTGGTFVTELIYGE